MNTSTILCRAPVPPPRSAPIAGRATVTIVVLSSSRKVPTQAAVSGRQETGGGSAAGPEPFVAAVVSGRSGYEASAMHRTML